MQRCGRQQELPSVFVIFPDACPVCGQAGADEQHVFWTCPKLPQHGLDDVADTQKYVDTVVKEPEHACFG